MRLVDRSGLGFQDDFEGYIYSREGSPVLQLHQYPDYWTLFWLGRVELRQLAKSLSEILAEFASILNVPIGVLNRGVAEYGIGSSFVRVPFANPAIEREHGDFLRQNLSSIDFVRFDVETSTPIILWGDIGRNPGSEVGFSSTLIPHAVFNLIRTTCVARISDHELSSLEDQILEKTGSIVSAR